MTLTLWLAVALLAPQAAGLPPEVVAEVRVHGNHTTPDAEILTLAGITIGQPLDSQDLEDIVRRLERTGRFEGVEVRKRYRSLTDTQSVVLVLIIDERPSGGGIPIPTVLRPVQVLRERLMFLPVITYADGYGLSYGGRASFANLLGGRSRVSVPLTWGAHKRAAVEGERLFARGPFSRVEGGGSIGTRDNPFFDVGDRRAEVWLRAERRLLPDLRLGGRVGWTDVSFGGRGDGAGQVPAFDLDDRFTSYGADLTYDTRRDPTFPRNAIHARVSWEALRFSHGQNLGPEQNRTRSEGGARPTRVNRYTLEARGYVGLIRSSVLSVRALYGGANGPLPVYEQWLLGGASTLRGFRAGTFAGDRLFTSTVELRVPLTSPMNVGKAGFTVFADAGKVWADGGRAADARYHRGAGVGVFFTATLLQLNVDVARGSTGDTRVHVGAGFSF